MKYIDDFNKFDSKKDFVKYLMKSHKVKKTTAERQYYRIKAFLKEKPNSAKMLHIMQLHDSGVKITKNYLINNYYSNNEIQWLKNDGMKIED